MKRLDIKMKEQTLTFEIIEEYCISKYRKGGNPLPRLRKWLKDMGVGLSAVYMETDVPINIGQVIEWSKNKNLPLLVIHALMADGDGLSDTDETQFGTDKFNPDTDNDGTWDNIEYEESQMVIQPEPEPTPESTPQPKPTSSKESSGGGCTLNKNANFDPTLIFLIFGAIGYIIYRRRRKLSVA